MAITTPVLTKGKAVVTPTPTIPKSLVNTNVGKNRLTMLSNKNQPGLIADDPQRNVDVGVKALTGDVAAQNTLKTAATPTANQNTYHSNQQSYNDALAKDLGTYTGGVNQTYDDYMKAVQANSDEYLKGIGANNQQWQGNLGGAYDSYINTMQGDRNKYIGELNDAEKFAMDGQDVMLNSTMSTLDARNFQQMQQVQQQMANMGMGNSGMAADAYMRATMGANQDYQRAFADAAVNKANFKGEYTDKRGNVNMQYTDKIGGAGIDKTNALGSLQQQYLDAVNNNKTFTTDRIGGLGIEKNDKLGQAQATYTDKKHASDDYYTQRYKEHDQQLKDEKAAKDAAKAKAIADAQASQTTQDKYLTEQSGYIYQNGKPLLIDGKPVSTIERDKLNETSRHNQSTETNTATKNQNDYTLGQDRNNIDREKLAADITQNIAKNKIDYAKLDYNYAKLDASNAYNQDKIAIAAENAQTAKDKNQITALGKKSDQLAQQIMQYQKKGDKMTDKDRKALKKIIGEYNKTNDQISSVIGGQSFKGNKEGGGGQYNNYYKSSSFENTQSMKTFNNHMTAAIQKGVSFADVKPLTELIARESGLNPNAKNPKSTARGYGQFLDATVKNYAKNYPNLDYNNPVDQIVLTSLYAKERYGSVENALKFWDANKWY